MQPRNRRGTVLVASLVVLALLSLLGAGSLMTATLDTRLAMNQQVNKEAFYAAEAALDTAVGRVIGAFREQLRPYVPGSSAGWTEPATADGDPYDNPFNGYTTEFRIENGLDPNNPASAPDPYVYTTVQSGQGVLHFAYTYAVRARATGEDGNELVAETVQVLETPLVQYYIFFDDDLSWHSGPAMTSWGRVHTNGNLYFAPGSPITFNNFYGTTFTPNILSVVGDIRVGEYLFEGNTTGFRTSGGVYVRVRNLTTTATSSSDYENVNTSITAANQATQEARFVDADGVGHVRTGVDRLPSASFQTLQRGGFYEQMADGPTRPDVDGMKILAGNGSLEIWFTPNGGSPTDVTSLVQNYQVATGTYVDFASWPTGAITVASPDGSGNNRLAAEVYDPGSTAAGTVALYPGTIVYSPEAVVTTDDTGNVLYDASRSTGGTPNPWYPCVLERADPRENKDVDLLVIDLQRLQLWYRDYIDWADNGAFDGSTSESDRQLLIYASRTPSTGFTAGTTLQALKIVGSRAGRTRNVDDRQTSPTLYTRTTLVTDNPVYIDGDLNAPGAAAGSNDPGASFGLAIVSDMTTLLSNRWGNNRAATNSDSDEHTFGFTGGSYEKPNARATAFNAAIFTGRFNFRAGGSGEEAGIHNFPRFIEDWGGQNCFITGCLINLWFSQQATAEFRCCGRGFGDVYSPPSRNFGWDVGFMNQDYWPPYVPSIYSVERQAWRDE